MRIYPDLSGADPFDVSVNRRGVRRRRTPGSATGRMPGPQGIVVPLMLAIPDWDYLEKRWRYMLSPSSFRKP